MEEQRTKLWFIPDQDTAETIHWHPWPQLLYQINGRTELTVGQESLLLHAQDIVVINSYTMHMHRFLSGQAILLRLNIPLFVQAFDFSPTQHFSCNSVTDTQSDFSVLRQALAQYLLLQMKASSDSLCSAAALQVFILLVHQFSDSSAPDTVPSSFTHLQAAISYMEQHYTEPVRIQDVAAACHLSAAHLAHIFSEELGTSPSDYLTTMRLSHAVDLLSHTSMKVSDIAEHTGFVEARRLNTAFRRRYGVLPQIWRKTAGEDQKQPPADPSVRSACERALTAAARGITMTKQLHPPTIDIAQKREALPDSMCRLLCAGTYAHLLDENYLRQLTKLQEIFHFKEALISDLFSPRTLPAITIGSTISWDFSVIDRILDFLLSLQLTPLLSLSCVPDMLAPPDSLRMGEAAVSPPRDLQAWDRLLLDFFAHLIGRYGKQACAGWKYSIWTLQETSAPELLDFYLHSCRLVRDSYPFLPLGSPNLENSASDSSHALLTRFLSYCTQHDWQPDFYLLYSYPATHTQDDITAGTQDTYYTESTEYLTAVCTQLHRTCAVPIYVEWNSCPDGCHNYFQDTTYKAANLVPALLSLPADLTALGLRDLIDTFYLHRNSSDFDGSHGLITRHGLPKAACFAYAFVHALEGRILLQTNQLIVVRQDDTIRLLCWNNQHFPYRIRKNRSQKNVLNLLGETRLLRTDDDSPVFEDPLLRHTMLDTARLQLTVRLTGLREGAWRMKEEILNDQYGCAFQNWVHIGAPSLEDAEIMDYLKRITIPAKKISVRTVSRELTLTHTLQPNEIYAVRLTPV